MHRDTLSFYEPKQQARPVSIVSIPLELGSDERGLAAAPKYLLDHGLEKMLAAIGCERASTTTIPCPKPRLVASIGRAKNLDPIVATARASCAAVSRAVQRNEIVVSLGGDHSAAIGSISGAASANPSLGVIWIDAHPDANTIETTITGNIHGMVTAALMGFGHPLLTEVGGTQRKIAPENFLYIGLKDFDQAEIEFLRRERIQTVTMLEIATRGLSRTMLAIEALARKVDTIWVSMDMDSIDSAYAPAVGMPTHGGLTRREALALAHHIGTTCMIAGLDVVEIVPAKDKDGMTAGLALELIARFLGAEYTWYREYMEQYREANIAVHA
jgi:arginase